jgi:DnaA-homolog protein
MEKKALIKQKALDIKIHQAKTLEDFIFTTENKILEHHLLTKTPEKITYIFGDSAVGKSHLLQACCELYSTAIYLPLKILGDAEPNILTSLQDYAYIALDDLESIAGNRIWEEAILHLYNNKKDTSVLVISNTHAPMHSNITLQDLKSRLSWGRSFPLYELDDLSKVVVLEKRARVHGFNLSPQTSKFLLEHCSRNMHDLDNIFAKLDAASLEEKRKITIPFVKMILNL